MAVKDYYLLLGIKPIAPADEVKRSFRLQIARYHPDKVQHLGTEFQAMAAERASELTEAYRVLSDTSRRAEYDRLREAGAFTSAPSDSTAASSAAERQRPAPDTAAVAEPPPEPELRSSPGDIFVEERASRDVFVRKATTNRFRQAIAATLAGVYDDAQAPGFDIAWVPKSKRFVRSSGLRLLGRFVARVDAETVADAWTHAAKWNAAASDDVCVFLMGSALAPVRELAEAIAEQRRRPGRGGKVILIPIDVRDWKAHLPLDVPAVAKNLLARLRSGG